jgi:Na+-translocating ferredoxin:NAD+ oxidoreductase subunit A
MSALLVLAIGILLLNYWLCAPLRDDVDGQFDATSGLFSAIALALTAPLTWLVDQVASSSPQLGALRAVSVILIVSVFAQLGLRLLASRVELTPLAREVLRRRVLLNCSVLAVALLHSPLLGPFGETLLLGVAVGAGLEFALYVFTLQQMRIARAPVPAPFRGAPIALISAGLMALAFMGLTGLL